MDKQYEPGLYRRYVVTVPYIDGVVDTSWHEYDRDEQAERDVALGKAVRAVLSDCSIAEICTWPLSDEYPYVVRDLLRHIATPLEAEHEQL
jgi:hypothetical protein